MVQADETGDEASLPTCRTPLAIQFESLLDGWEELLKKINLNLSSHQVPELETIAKSLDIGLFHIRLWTRDVTIEEQRCQYSACDGLEMMDGRSELAETIRAVLDKMELAMAKAKKAYRDGQDPALKDVSEHSLKLVETANELDQYKARFVSTVHELAAAREVDTSAKSINVISFDGGGVRSYASLLVLRTLMDEIRAFIRGDREKAGLEDTEYNLRPRDIFDLFVGSGSGGLIATMLGRLRMTENECIAGFRDYADGIFGHPRLLWYICPWFVKKYSNRDMREAISNAIGKDNPDGQEWERNLFALSTDRCKTAFVAYRVRRGQRKGTAYLFRTYANPTLLDPAKSQDFSSTTDVPKATSAAPQFFKSIEIGDSAYYYSGLGFNNPSMYAFKEASRIAGRASHRICLVSIGSGTKMAKLSGPVRSMSGSLVRRQSLLHRMLTDTTTDTEKTHRKVVTIMESHGSPYYRFDPDGLRSTKLDEWQVSNHSDGRKDFRTIDHIDEAVERYLQDARVLKDLRECARKIVYNRRARL